MTIFKGDLLAGRTAVVTGGGSGINQRIATRMAELGAAVCVIGRRQERLDQTVNLIERAGGRAIGLASDVRNDTRLAECMAEVSYRYGPIDILVCGAAGNFPSKAVSLSSNGFRAVMEIDVLGTFNTARTAFGHLRTPGASIINISAIQSILPVANQIHVNAAKAGVDMITRTLALEWGPLGVRVNSIAPGPVADTEGMERLAPGEQLVEMASRIPLRRVATKDDIADLAIFLASSGACNITGAILLTDGGQSLVGYQVDDGAGVRPTRGTPDRAPPYGGAEPCLG